MTTFNWTISAAERELSLDGLENVIKTIHWRYKGTDENGVTAETYGATSIGNPNPENFTPWKEVSDPVAIQWLENIMSKVPEVAEGEEPRPTQLESMQANIEAQIALLIAPTTITGPLYSEPVIIEEEIIEQEQTVLDTEE
jgi:hypothetical protein